MLRSGRLRLLQRFMCVFTDETHSGHDMFIVNGQNLRRPPGGHDKIFQAPERPPRSHLIHGIRA